MADDDGGNGFVAATDDDNDINDYDADALRTIFKGQRTKNRHY